MEVLLKDSIFVNSELIGIFIAGTVIGAVVFLGFLYFYLVNKTKIFFLASLFLLSTFIRLFCKAFILVNESMGRLVYFNVVYYEWIILGSSLLTAYMVMVMVAYFYEKKSYVHYFIGVIFMALMIYPGRLYYSDSIILAIYTLIIVGSYLLFVTYTIYKASGLKNINRKNVVIIHTLIGMIVSAVINVFTTNLDYYEWVLALALVLFIGVIFFRNYRVIYEHRENMYQKLIYDPIIKCYSKNYLIERCQASKYGAVIFIDFNHFKWVNDEFGHIVGDELIKGFTHRVNNKLKSNMILGRFGGDEFIVLMEENNAQGAKDFSILLIDEFSHAVEDLELPMVKTNLGISVGIAMYNETDTNDALNRADIAMYDSKAKGNNYITILE